MQHPPVLPNEASRLQTLAELQLLDTAGEPGYDALVRAAALGCEVPIALISLVDERRQWFKANHGLEGTTETPRDVAFCAHAIAGSGVLEVPDALADPRFRDNPLVTGGPKIRFYAGVPLTLDNGDAMGSLCIIDQRPRRLLPHQRQMLMHLAEAAVLVIEQRHRLVQADLRQRQLLQQLAASPIGLFSLDARGRLDRCNPRMESLWQQPELALLGDHWLDAIELGDREMVRGSWSRCLAQRQPLAVRFRMQVLNAQGQQRQVWLQAVPQSDGRWSGCCDELLVRDASRA